MPFIFKKTTLDRVVSVKSLPMSDPRGVFIETYKMSDFYKNGIEEVFTQDNYSYTKNKYTLRGIHFQKNPKPQGKLVRCVQGSIFDVAVDLRPHSANYKKWVGFELSEKNNEMLYIPPGFGHGFLTLEPNTCVAYKCTNEYDHKLDSGIIWNDPSLNINWGLNGNQPILSEKDKYLSKLHS